MRGTDGGSTPWWAETHLRMLVLLAMLAAVAGYGVPRIARGANDGSVGVRPCPAVRIGSQPVWSLARLNAEVSKSGLRALVGYGTLDTEGLQSADAAWTDGYPKPPTSLPFPGLAPAGAGYEIRWWSPENDHQSAAVFAFSSASAAAEYARTAGTTSCRNDATAYALRRPAGGRAVIWSNPLGVLQADVLVARGRVVYLTTEVPPIGLPPPTDQLVAIPADLACELRDVDCSG